MTADVVVIGAGFAGLSAAVRLAAAGRRVVVCEEAPRLGGRATSFVDRESGTRVDNGQHVLFGCYRETYRFLETIGTASRAPLQSRLTLTMADERGRMATLRCPRWPAPWHLVGGLLGWRALGLGDRLRTRHVAGILRRAAREGAAAVAAGVPAALTVSDWLREGGQSRAICDWLWHPLAYAALNQPPEVAAARPFVRVLCELFGPRAEDAAIGLPAVPLDDLYAHPAAAFIQARGGVVRVKSPARVRLSPDDAAVAGVDTPDGPIDAPVVISSVPWHAFARIWSGAPPVALAPVATAAARVEGSPIVTVNLWFDGPVMPHAFLGLVGGPMHWVFDAHAIAGGASGHLSIVSSGASSLASMPNGDLTRAAVEQLGRALPESRARQLRRSVVVREHRATFSLAPGAPERPGAVTPVRGFYLAGDWTDTGLPATIEGAVRSGVGAADGVLRLAC